MFPLKLIHGWFLEHVYLNSNFLINVALKLVPILVHLRKSSALGVKTRLVHLNLNNSHQCSIKTDFYPSAISKL
ncbi:hypothetical protein Lalb_Chr10g0094171 [Lupinus albus]|uniref:Uncharacterized protein n=1 Tax=Lupinus albus TaxID=3870 RepID=A0A6A4PV37_LUPAL|nr:hypothetical protein Lalb_Chr10g0094171 [Lupinus albus]